MRRYNHPNDSAIHGEDYYDPRPAIIGEGAESEEELL
jgi:hypothetical protein